MSNKQLLWGGRFTGGLDPLYDVFLVYQDYY